jgi:hypothetical protein
VERPPEETAQQQHAKNTKTILSQRTFSTPTPVGVEKVRFIKTAKISGIENGYPRRERRL